MLIPEDYLRNVVFLCVKKSTGEGAFQSLPGGTAFFVDRMETNGIIFIYAVTCSHVIEASREFGTLFLRLNKPGGGADYFPVPQDEWIPHHATDLSIIPLKLPTGTFGVGLYRSLQSVRFVQEGQALHPPIGVGDEVFLRDSSANTLEEIAIFPLCDLAILRSCHRMKGFG
jgi:hypothetical protein